MFAQIRVESLVVLEGLLNAVRPYELDPLDALYGLKALDEKARHIGALVEHVLVDGMKDGLGHELAGLQALAQKALLLLLYDKENEDAETYERKPDGQVQNFGFKALPEHSVTPGKFSTALLWARPGTRLDEKT